MSKGELSSKTTLNVEESAAQNENFAQAVNSNFERLFEKLNGLQINVTELSEHQSQTDAHLKDLKDNSLRPAVGPLALHSLTTRIAPSQILQRWFRIVSQTT